MVRLVFRPYTQVWRTICTSVSLRASIRVSPDFTLLRHSSPSFGSEPYAHTQTSLRRSKVGRLCKTKKSKLLLSLCIQVCHPHTRDGVRLLGPCFKTGRIEPFSQRPRTPIRTTHQSWETALRDSTTFHIYAALKTPAFLNRGKGLNISYPKHRSESNNQQSIPEHPIHVDKNYEKQNKEAQQPQPLALTVKRNSPR